MSFQEKYQLLEPLAGEGADSFRARQIKGGREVAAHFLPGGKSSEETKALMARLINLPPPSMAKLLEVGEWEGRSFVVVAAPPFLHFQQWLVAEEQGAGRAPTGSNGPAHSPPPSELTGFFPAQNPAARPSQQEAAPPSASEPGEFTRQFQAPEPSANTHVSQPGEFTRMFQAGQQPSAAAAPPVMEPPPAAPPAAAPAGEFTRLFQTASQIPAAAAPPPVSAPPPPPPAQQGEFTKLFQATSQQQAPAAPPPPPAQTQAGPQGEFTRLFQTAQQQAPTAQPFAAPAAPPPPPPTAAKPGEFTRLFQAPPPSGTVPERAFEQNPLPSGSFGNAPGAPASGMPWDQPAAQPSGPGEYTRLFQSAPAQNPFQPPPAAPAPEPGGDFTRIFGRPGSPAPPPVPDMPVAQTPVVQPPPPPPPHSSGPSEYTRLMAASSAPMGAPPMAPAPAMPQYTPPPMPQMPAPPAVAAPSAPAAAPSTNIVLLAIVGVVGFLLGVLVTYLLLHR